MKKILFLLMLIILISECSKEIEIKHNAVEPTIDVISIYESNNYRYVINITDEAYVKYGWKKLSFKEALDKNIVTIDDIIKRNSRVFKEQKYQKNEDIKILYRPEGVADSLLMDITFYGDEEYSYYTTDYLIAKIVAYVEYDGQHISYEDALNQNLISIEDLIDAGFNFEKVKK